MVETGHFATCGGRWPRAGASRWTHAGDWRHGADPADIEARLAQESAHAIKAVMVVPQRDLHWRHQPRRRHPRRDGQGRPSRAAAGRYNLLARSVDYRHDEWKVDVTSAVRKKVYAAAGLGFNAISEKARAAARPTGCRAPTGTGRRC